ACRPLPLRDAMSSLLKIRSERDQMSAIERRIADFLLENAHLLRDYSSQQLADALRISQSSVVKFSQKLGFKGYPDLKLSVGEEIARANGGNGGAAAQAAKADEETRLINTPDKIDEIATLIGAASKVFLIGLGEDSVSAQAFAARLSL